MRSPRPNRPGYKLKAPLFCYDCKRSTRKFGDTILDAFKCVVGHRCIKCTRKNFVKGRPEGQGWRRAFGDLVQTLKGKKKNGSSN